MLLLLTFMVVVTIGALHSQCHPWHCCFPRFPLVTCLCACKHLPRRYACISLMYESRATCCYDLVCIILSRFVRRSDKRGAQPHALQASADVEVRVCAARTQGHEAQYITHSVECTQARVMLSSDHIAVIQVNRRAVCGFSSAWPQPGRSHAMGTMMGRPLPSIVPMLISQTWPSKQGLL